MAETVTITSQPKFNLYSEITNLVENYSPAWVLVGVILLGVCFAVLVYLCQLLGAKICQMLCQENTEDQIMDSSSRRYRSYSSCHVYSDSPSILPLHQQRESVERATKATFLDEILLKRDGVLPPPEYHEEERAQLEKDVFTLYLHFKYRRDGSSSPNPTQKV